MKIMSDIFLTVLGMSLTATYCILAVCLLRILLRRMPKIFSYVLWSVVAFRLICPVTPESSLSLMQNRVSQSAHRIATAGATTETNFPAREQSALGSDFSMPDAPQESISLVSEVGSKTGSGTASNAETMQEMTKANRKPQKALYGWNPIGFCSAVWFLGVSVLCAGSLYRYLRLKIKLEKIASENVSGHDNKSNKRFSIRSASVIGTPFVIGILHPVIYLPKNLTPQEYRYCLAHEEMHIRRFDHLLKLILSTSLYTFPSRNL